MLRCGACLLLINSFAVTVYLIYTLQPADTMFDVAPVRPSPHMWQPWHHVCAADARWKCTIADASGQTRGAGRDSRVHAPTHIAVILRQGIQHAIWQQPRCQRNEPRWHPVSCGGCVPRRGAWREVSACRMSGVVVAAAGCEFCGSVLRRSLAKKPSKTCLYSA